jgi:2-phosphosulfolactate phosphatase
VITTTNGTRAILASLEAKRVVIAAFVNLTATIELLKVNLFKARGLPIHLVCSGTEGFVSAEDSLLAGALATHLSDQGAILGNDEAIMTSRFWASAAREMVEQPLAALLAEGRGGHNVRRIGLPGDIEDAARIDRFHLTAELCQREGMLKIKKTLFTRAVHPHEVSDLSDLSDPPDTDFRGTID